MRVIWSLVLVTLPPGCVGESGGEVSSSGGGASSASGGGGVERERGRGVERERRWNVEREVGAGASSASGGGTSSASGGGASSASGGGASSASGGGAGGDPGPGACGVTRDRVRITEVDVGGRVINNEDEAALKPLVISPIPSGGSRLAWMSDDGQVHILQLDADDRAAGRSFGLPANDFADLYADDSGGVLLLTRDAEGGGTLNCGTPSNLCGTPPSPLIACHDMYMVRFDGERATWATKLTSSSAALPPYSTGPAGPEVYMIWWYAHHGRIAFDGSRYAGLFRRRDQRLARRVHQHPSGRSHEGRRRERGA